MPCCALGFQYCWSQGSALCSSALLVVWAVCYQAARQGSLRRVPPQLPGTCLLEQLPSLLQDQTVSGQGQA